MEGRASSGMKPACALRSCRCRGEGAGRDVWTLPGAEGQGQWQGQAGPMHLPCRVHPEPVERWEWTRGPNRDECPAALGSQVMQSRELVVEAPPFTPKPPSLNVPPGVKSKPLCEPHTPPSASLTQLPPLSPWLIPLLLIGLPDGLQKCGRPARVPRAFALAGPLSRRPAPQHPNFLSCPHLESPPKCHLVGEALRPVCTEGHGLRLLALSPHYASPRPASPPPSSSFSLATAHGPARHQL